MDPTLTCYPGLWCFTFGNISAKLGNNSSARNLLPLYAPYIWYPGLWSVLRIQIRDPVLFLTPGSGIRDKPSRFATLLVVLHIWQHLIQIRQQLIRWLYVVFLCPLLGTSVADLWHFGVDPDPRILASNWWNLLFSSFIFKFFSFPAYKVHFHHTVKSKRSHKTVGIKVFFTISAWW